MENPKIIEVSQKIQYSDPLYSKIACLSKLSMNSTELQFNESIGETIGESLGSDLQFQVFVIILFRFLNVCVRCGSELVATESRACANALAPTEKRVAISLTLRWWRQ